MASAAQTPPPVTGRVDALGRLVEADTLLLDLQLEAGSELGGKLALPQLAAVARLVRKLGIAVSRPAVVAGQDHDVEMWVRAEPQGEDVVLTIEKWRKRAPSPSRLEVAASDDDLIGKAVRNSWATDAELRFTTVSDELAQLVGVSASEAAGQPLTRLLRLEEGEDGAMPLLSALASRSAFSGQAAVARSGNGQRIMLSGEPVRGDDGKFAGFRGRALADHVPVPEAANEPGGAAATIDPALDQALRSPLARIISAAEGIVERSDGPLRSDYAAYAGDIAAAARHLLSVIRSMVDQPGETADTIDLAALAGDAVALVQPQADERNVVLVMTGEATIHVHGDRRGVIQVLVNLLGNAVRHSPEGGSVTVDLSRSGNTGDVAIADQGKGIAPEDQERIFEKFERLEDGGGAGLGLAIARRLARSMGGEISLQSTPGEGARFTVSLPLA
ncbi:sensor histidine kinase [Sphingomonas alba]|uniref:histidine kinase n=1 Tax=Sphingomonas alba TaxID=2908208 RepID=A0ABT0RIH8_9SPHN|nr:ATP-binding protein [Sphingomonas alba]